MKRSQRDLGRNIEKEHKKRRSDRNPINGKQWEYRDDHQHLILPKGEYGQSLRCIMCDAEFKSTVLVNKTMMNNPFDSMCACVNKRQTSVKQASETPSTLDDPSQFTKSRRTHVSPETTHLLHVRKAGS